VGSVADVRHEQQTVRSGFLPDRIVHLHPTRLCNLACLHCYSESDQRQRSALDPDLLRAALDVLRCEGYSLLSLSGGEPLVYPALADVVSHARSIGFRVTMITNGLLATERHDALLDMLDGMAISFDGMAETHNALRGRNDAFEKACTALQRNAARGRPVAAAISLTRNALVDLPDLADHLVALGARAIQIRPVARAGRARGLDDSSFFSDADQVRLFLIVHALRQELPDGITLHCDLAPTEGLWQQRDAYAGLLGCAESVPYAERPLSDLVNPLVITDTGALKPIAFDFDARYDLMSIEDVTERALHDYKQERLSPLQDLIGGAVASLEGARGLVDWFDKCARLSERVP
jgi:Fe-coproporphyrin III synthase